MVDRVLYPQPPSNVRLSWSEGTTCTTSPSENKLHETGPALNFFNNLSHHLQWSTLPSLQSQGRRHSSTGEWKTRSKCFPSKGGKRTDPTPTMGNEREARSNACRSLHDFPAHEMGWDGRNKAIEHVWPIYASCAIDPTLPNQWASAFMAIETLGKGWTAKANVCIPQKRTRDVETSRKRKVAYEHTRSPVYPMFKSRTTSWSYPSSLLHLRHDSKRSPRWKGGTIEWKLC